MKIHTTQNLNNSAHISSTTSQQTVNMRKHLMMQSDMYSERTGASVSSSGISFKAKNPLKDFGLLDKAAKKAKKTLGKRVANTRVFKKLSNSNSFGKALEYVNKQEAMIQAITALVICCGLRPATIRALPGDKNKKDCDYAAAHSISSGIWGFLVSFLFIKHLANGYNHAVKNMHLYAKDLSVIKERLPHVNIETLKGKNGTIKNLKEGLDIMGNKIITNMNEVQKIPVPKHLMSEASDATLKELMPNIDLALSKKLGKWVDKSSNELMPEIESLFFAVEKVDAKGKATQHYFPFLTADEAVLKDVFKGLKLDSIKDKNGKMKNPLEWEFDNGFKIKREHLFSSNWNDSGEACIPLITGFRKDGSKQCYLNNNNIDIKGSLGTKVTLEMSEADRVNMVLDKLGGWLPDIIVAYPRATATIAIIPFILQKVLGMEKSSKKPKVEENNENKKVVA